MSKKKDESGTDAAIFEAVDLLVNQGGGRLTTVLAEERLLKQLTKRLIEKALESEMDNDANNPRNGVSTKNLIIDNGQISSNAFL